jgi:hypothetical protein
MKKAIDRRPGSTPIPAPSHPKMRFSPYGPRRAFDLPMALFVLGGTLLILYSLDRLGFEGRYMEYAAELVRRFRFALRF